MTSEGNSFHCHNIVCYFINYVCDISHDTTLLVNILYVENSFA